MLIDPAARIGLVLQEPGRQRRRPRATATKPQHPSWRLRFDHRRKRQYGLGRGTRTGAAAQQPRYPAHPIRKARAKQFCD
jgi:hypothetical protein